MVGEVAIQIKSVFCSLIDDSTFKLVLEVVFGWYLFVIT